MERKGNYVRERSKCGNISGIDTKTKEQRRLVAFFLQEHKLLPKCAYWMEPCNLNAVLITGGF